MRVQSSIALFTFAKVKVGFLYSLAIGGFCLLPFANVAASVESSVQGFPLEQQLKLNSAQQNTNSKKFNKALKLVDSVLEKHPEQLTARFIRARALSGLGKLGEAVNDYQLILESTTNIKRFIPEIYNNLATLYAKQGKLDLAIQTLKQGIATNEQYKTLYDNLSAVYVEMARGAYSKALKLGVQAKSVQLKTLQLSSLQQASLSQQPKVINSSGITHLNKLPEPLSKVKPNTVAVSAEQPRPVVAPVPIVKPASQTPKINKDEVITALNRWAAAWSAQSVDLYLSFYGKDFKPVNLSKKVWAVQRRIRLSKPRWVSVRLKDFDVQQAVAQNNTAIVQLVQDYRADNYHDKTQKQFVMQRTADGWRILSEQSLAVIR